MSYHLFLSPHLDDVPLSCGGTLAQLINNRETVEVMTIFAGVLPAHRPISDFAAYQHQMWGDPEQAYETRRLEDKDALDTFDLKPIWLDFLDCIYRGNVEQRQWYYTSDEDIFGLLHPAEYQTIDPVFAAITQHISTLPDQPDMTIYGPLTVGRHVDHQLAFLVTLKFALAGYRVLFYEEFPYTDRDPQYLTTALQETTPALLKQIGLTPSTTKPEPWHSEIQLLTAQALARKIAAISAYQTQLEVLFGGKAAMIERVTAYANQVGQGEPAERFWQLTL